MQRRRRRAIDQIQSQRRQIVFFDLERGQSAAGGMPVIPAAVAVVAAAAVAAVVAAVAVSGNCFLIFDPQLQILF